jgi:hypothetical protein
MLLRVSVLDVRVVDLHVVVEEVVLLALQEEILK